MSPRSSTLVLLLLVVGLLLLANPLWLFPHEGETRYTYERVDLRVENGTITYHGESILGFAEENSLTAVGCQPRDDDQLRACAFDHYLASQAPVTVATAPAGVSRPEFVELDGQYYRRIHRPSGGDGSGSTTYDVEHVAPRRVLAESATDIPGESVSGSDYLPLEFQIAVSGDTERSFVDLAEDDLGTIFVRNDEYYTVVATGDRVFDGGPDLLRYDLPRYLLSLVGLAVVAGAVVVLSRELDR